MEKRFDIKRTEEVTKLIDKYETYQKDFIPSEQEQMVFAVLPYLSEWEKVVLYALTEFKSVRAFARFFGVTQYTAYTTITDIKDKMKELLKREGKK